MAEPQNVVENIRIALAESYSEVFSPAELVQLAEDYAQLCTQVNERMKLSIPFLREGNLSEALRLVEMKPNVLELYALLESIDRSKWIDMVTLCDYQIPAQLNSDLARDLQKAYEQHQEQLPHLKKFRLLAFAGAPISMRLPVLRQLLLLAPENTRWAEDRDAYELIRQKELVGEVNQAVRTNDLTAIQRCYTELSRDDWAVAPKPELLVKLKRMIQSDFQANAVRQMQGLAEQLIQAHAEYDVEKGIKLEAELLHKAETAHMNVPADIQANIQPVRNWLETERKRERLEREFTNVLDRLEKALERETPMEELHILHNALERAAENAELPIPESLEEHFRQMVGMQQLGKSRKTRLIFAGIFAACAFVVGLTITLAFLWSHEKNVQTYVTQIQEVIQSDDLVQMKNHLESLMTGKQTRAMNDPQVQSGLVQLKSEIETRESRSQLFQETLKQAEKQLDQDDFNPQQFMKTLEKAKELAQNESDQISIVNIESRYKVIQQKKQQKRDQDFQEQLSVYKDQLQAHQQEKYSSNEAKTQRLKELIETGRNLAKMPEISE
ncbi:MAG: hypothetical protein ACRC10_08285 [Thermoguttaceae bacterium]